MCQKIYRLVIDKNNSNRVYLQIPVLFINRLNTYKGRPTLMKTLDQNENPRKRFKRLATKRANEVLYRLKVLGNCSNKSFYYYTDDDINKIFSALEDQMRFVKAKFKSPRQRLKL